MSYKGAWYTINATRVGVLQSAGLNFFLSYYDNDSQIDACLAAVPTGQPVCVLLSGDDTEKFRQVTRLANYGSVTGFMFDDESNLAGMSIADQQTRYSAIKAIAPWKMVFGSYNLNLASSTCMANHQRVGCWDYILCNRYSLRWGVSNSDAATDLATVLAAARSFFASGCDIIPVEQAAGVISGSSPQCRPIGGLLQTQHTMWVNAGMVPLGAWVFYGDATNPEDDNLTTNSTLLTEAAAVY